MNQDSLVGTWKLVSFELRSTDGQVFYPLGTDALGYLIYSEDGYMAVAIMRSSAHCTRSSTDTKSSSANFSS